MKQINKLVFAAALAAFFVSPSWADSKISALSSCGALNASTDEFLVSDNATTNCKTTGADIASVVFLQNATNLTLATGGGLRTATSNGNTALLRAYDVDNTQYVTFGTLTASNTPTFDLATGVTIGTSYIYRAGGNDVATADGGLGISWSDPNEDVILFWDDSAGGFAPLTIGTGLTITDDEITADAAGLVDGDYGDWTISSSGTVATIDADAVTYAKMQNISATDRILGRDTAGAGNTEELTVGGGIEFTGSGGIQRGALSGDVAASAGSGATTIGNDKITEAMLKAVNSPTDEYCLTKEDTAGDFEWQACGGANASSIVFDPTGLSNTDATDVQEMGEDFDAAIDALVAGALPDADYGDIVVSSSGTVWAIDSGVVTAAAKTALDDATVADMVNTLGGASSTGTGGLVRATSPTLVTPALGTIASGVGTALTALDGENIQADTIDDDSIDFADVTLADITFDVGSVDTTEFGYLNGVTSGIQAQINAIGTPTVITVEDTTDTTSSFAFFESAAGDLGPKTDGGATYNATTGMATFTGITGPLTGASTDLDCTDCIGATEISDVYLLNNGDVATGVYDFGGATSFEIPSGVSVAVTGQIGLGSAEIGWAHAFMNYYADESMSVVAIPTADLGAPSDGDVVSYNATNDKFELSSPSGAAFDSTAVDAATWSDGANASNVWTFDVSGTDHTMTAGNGLMTFGDSVTVTDVLSTPTLTLTGTGTINGLDAVDATGEDTVEALIFDADAQNISGVWEVQDDVDLVFGNDADWSVNYDESVDNQLIFLTAQTAATATGDPLFEIIGGAAATANQQYFGVSKGTQSSNTELFTVDEDGDGVFGGALNMTGAFTMGGTGALNGLDQVDSTTETTLEGAIDIAGDITGTGLGSVSITSGVIVDADVNASAAIAHSKMATALKTLYIPAAAMKPTTTAGCAALAAVEISSSQPEVFSLDCDAATDEKAQFQFVPPKGWNNGTITYAVYWSHASTTTNFATIWGMECLAVSNDDTIGAAYGTAVTVTDTGGTTNDLYISPTSSALTIGGTPADADEVFCRVYRDANAGGDTLAIDARLMGVAIFYTQTTADDT